MPRRALVLATVVVSLLSAQTPNAMAATASGTDARGDAPASIDVTRLTVRNDQTRVTFHAKVRDLRKRGIFRFSMYDGMSGAEFKARRRADGTVAVQAFNTDLDDTYAVPCAGVRGAWQTGKDRLKVSVPQSCFRVTKTPSSWDVWVQSRTTSSGGKKDRVEPFSVVRG